MTDPQTPKEESRSLGSKALFVGALLLLPASWQVLARVLAEFDIPALWMWIALSLLEWLLGGVIVWALLRAYRINLEDVGMPRGRSRVALVLGIVALSLAACGAKTALGQNVSTTNAYLMIAGAPTAGLVEETLFRGVGIGLGRRVLGSNAAAWALSIFAFAALHVGGGVPRFVSTACFGVGWAWLYRSTRSLKWPIATHWLFDLVVLFLRAS